MADLHEALKWLSPIEWADVPLDGLHQFVSQASSAGELICNSVPPLPKGTPAASTLPLLQNPNAARSAADIRSSEARPHPPHEDHEQLQSSWGKPVKINSKDNPLNVSIYKMAGRDRHGAWFARRSIHEGIGFDKFKRALQREFPHSLAVSGGPGAGAVRGIAADRLVEQETLEDGSRVQVYQLSAQFPGPTTAREFNTLILTTEDALSDKSGSHIDGKMHVPRHFMVLSKPISHPDASSRSGYVRGQYESVEMIREVPLSRPNLASQSTPDLTQQTHEKGSGRDRSATVAAARSSKTHHESTDPTGQDPELNPVEWIMITRSDPGGGIPRFLVDRGTPEAMISDVARFFDWACAFEEVPGADEDLDEQAKASESAAGGTDDNTASPEQNKHTSQESRGAYAQRGSTNEKSSQQPNGGFLWNLGSTIQSGLEAYAPTAVTEQMHQYLNVHESSSSSDDGSSTVSFLSAEEHRGDGALQDGRLSSGSTDDPTVVPSETSSISQVGVSTNRRNNHDKEAEKTAKQRIKANEKLARKRDEEEERFRKVAEKDDSNLEKARERRDREIQRLEEQHQRAVEKLNQKEAKERKKADDRRRKQDESNKVSLVSRQRDDLQTQVELSRRENALLLRQVESLQRENTLLTQVIGNLGGEDALVHVREQLANPKSKPASLQSGQSPPSLDALSPGSSKSSLGR